MEKEGKAPGPELLEQYLAFMNNVLEPLEQYLRDNIVGQDEYIDALLAGLAAGEHVALISPPGTAKSYAVSLLAKAIEGANVYKLLLNPYVGYDELFGPIDIKKLREGVVERKWSKIVDSHIVFLDEGFKANPALLNSLLSFLNERVVYDPFTGQERKVPLVLAVVASNEVPRQEELRALWDRIPIRVYGRYLKEPELLVEALEAAGEGPRPPEKRVKLEHIKHLERIIRWLALTPQGRRWLSRMLFGDEQFLNEYLKHLYKLAIELREKSDELLLSDRYLVSKLPKLLIALLLLYNLRYGSMAYALYLATRRVLEWSAGSEDALEDLQNMLKGLNNISDVLEKMAAVSQLALEQGYIDANTKNQLEQELDNAASATTDELTAPIVSQILAVARHELAAIPEAEAETA